MEKDGQFIGRVIGWLAVLLVLVAASIFTGAALALLLAGGV